jgi:hypothetical protein
VVNLSGQCSMPVDGKMKVGFRLHKIKKHFFFEKMKPTLLLKTGIIKKI